MTKRLNKEGSITQRKDGRWQGALHLGYDQTGKRVRKFVYGHSADEVLEKLQDIRERNRRGEPVSYDRQSVGAFLEQWLDAKEETVKPKTYDSYESHVRNHILPVLKNVNLGDLNQAHVLSLLKAVRKKGRSPRTVRDVYDLLRRAIEQAVRWDMVPRNVVAMVERPRVEHREMKFLEKDEVAALLSAVRGTRYEAVYTVAVLMGLRVGELLALRWKEDIDLERGLLRVNRTVYRLRGHLMFGTPKTAKSRRTIRLPRACIEALRRHRELLAFERKRAGEAWHEQGLVFPAYSPSHGGGGPIEPRNLARHLSQTLERAKVQQVRVHDLRHTAASIMIAQRFDPLVISQTLGHASVNITLNLYGHLMESHQQDFVDAIDAFYASL